MNKRLLFISLALALVLTTLVPATALAAKPEPFEASGTITYISPGTVFPAGQSDRWVVVERELTGELSGDISDDFTMTYKANVESVVTQAGNLHGTLEAGDYVLKVNGKIQPLDLEATTPEWVQLTEDWYVPSPDPPYYYVIPAGTWYPPGYPMPKLTISGYWSFIEGARGQGDFKAWAQFTTDMYGHVNAIYFSAFDLDGRWQP